MLRSWQAAAVGAGVLVFGGLGAGTWAWVAWVRPYGLPPRDEASIQADWERVQRFLPRDVERGTVAPELAASIQAAAVDEPPPEALADLAARVEAGASLPEPGCVLFEPPAELSDFVIAEAALHLAGGGHPVAAAELGRALRTRDLMGLLIGTSVAVEAGRHTPLGDRAPRLDELFPALAHEAVCTDRVLGKFASEDPVAAVEQLRGRDFFARLLVALDPVRTDPDATRAVLEAFDAVPWSASAALLCTSATSGAVHWLDELPQFADPAALLPPREEE